MRLVPLLLATTLASSALAVGTSSAAQAAEPFAPGLLGVERASSTVFTVATGNGTTRDVAQPPASVAPVDADLNQLGVSPEGTILAATDERKVYTYSTTTGLWRSTPRTLPAVENQMGGFNPADGLLYFGGFVTTSRDQYTFATYDPTTNRIPPRRIRVTAPDAPAANGDLLFDAQGNLYLVSGGDLGDAAGAVTTAQVYRVDAADLRAGTGVATKVGRPISTSVRITSIAFGTDGFLYLGGFRPNDVGGSAIQRVNPITGAASTAQPLPGRTLRDLASRATGVTVQVAEPAFEGRVKPTDRFTASVSGNGLGGPSTSGPDGVGPLLIVPSPTPYVVTQTPAAGTDPDDYDTTFRCVDLAADDAVLSSGSGSRATFTVGTGRPSVSCTFTNVPKARAAPEAPDETSTDNPLGRPVRVATRATGDGVDGSSVVLVGAPDDGRRLEVPGQGVWTVDPADGSVTFTPDDGFTADPDPVQYRVSDERGRTATGTVTVGFAPQAVDDDALLNPRGDVTVPVLANDRGTTDPASVRLDGAPSDGRELVVDGQGTWSVEAGNGDVTFAPEDGFTADPTPVDYTVRGPGGTATTSATVTVTYVPEAVDNVSAGNPPGAAVEVDVLANDLGTLDPTSVTILDAPGAGTTLEVPGEGTWTVEPTTGAITFTPVAGLEDDPAPVTYVVEDVRGESSEATVTVTFEETEGEPGGEAGDTDVDAGTAGGSEPTGDDARPLPDTGGAALGLLLAGSAALAAGTILLARRRRA